jgi:curved DNA-binding protein CbpA
VDHYETLGVARNASTPEIRRAYRRLARQHHPDVNSRPDGPERFAALASAYEILTDATARAHYDQTLPRRVPSNRSQGPFRSPRGEHPGAVTGILELSAREASHLAHHPLTLDDASGCAVMKLPRGLGHGDEIALWVDGRLAVLRINVRSGT